MAVLCIGEMLIDFIGDGVGSIDKIDKGKAVINYGAFTTSVALEELELVQKMK